MKCRKERLWAEKPELNGVGLWERGELCSSRKVGWGVWYLYWRKGINDWKVGIESICLREEHVSRYLLTDIYTVLLNSVDMSWERERERDKGRRDLEKREPNEMKLLLWRSTWINVHLFLSFSPFSVKFLSEISSEVNAHDWEWTHVWWRLVDSESMSAHTWHHPTSEDPGLTAHMLSLFNFFFLCFFTQLAYD